MGREYDPNGNLIVRLAGGNPIAGMVYDYRNQMVEYYDAVNEKTHTYAYDTFGRRIAKVIDLGGQGTTETRYFYGGPEQWQVLEEQDAAGATLATYVYSGLYIDDVVSMHRGGEDYFYHADDLHNVMAVTTGGGSVAERYEYGDYGQPLNPATLQPLGASLIAKPYLFTGRRYDQETGLYYYRTRYLDPFAGRFTTRDTIGIWGDPGALGSGVSYASCRPTSSWDPFGLADDWGPLRGRPGFNDFRRWFHKQYKQKIPGAPDATPEELDDAWEIWDALGRPNAEGHRPRPRPEAPNEFSCINPRGSRPETQVDMDGLRTAGVVAATTVIVIGGVAIVVVTVGAAAPAVGAAAVGGAGGGAVAGGGTAGGWAAGGLILAF